MYNFATSNNKKGRDTEREEYQLLLLCKHLKTIDKF